MKSRVRQRYGSRRSPEHESSNAGYHRPERLRYSGSSVQVLIVCGRITLAESDQIEFKYRSNICKDFTQMGVEILHSENHEFLVERTGSRRSSGRKDVRERDRLHLVAHSKSLHRVVIEPLQLLISPGARGAGILDSLRHVFSRPFRFCFLSSTWKIPRFRDWPPDSWYPQAWNDEYDHVKQRGYAATRLKSLVA